MGAIVMDGVVVESNSIIAAGAVVLEGTLVESGSTTLVCLPKVKVLVKNKQLDLLKVLPTII